ncbi:TonB-dependent receptor [Phenylobacterium sp.]|uniref:TonB-dependent receptor n=1 Tax=Phenylobacterium sp. TaxID=1871053 RepID=UPI0030F419C9
MLLALAATPHAAVAQAPQIAFNIPAGGLDQALVEFGAQSRLQLLYPAQLVRGRRADALQGLFTPEDALARLLAGSDIVVRRSRPNVLVLTERGADTRAATSSRMLASLDAVPAVVAELPATAGPAILDEIVVTGTHIRGAGAGASPIVELSRDAIDRSGYATVSEALGALPQAFGGVSTPTSTITATDTLGTNGALSTGVNLRGLGSDATLVLINGRRMAGTGSRGDFSDVSAVPTAAIARVDVLLDGASALYGSDAVGGVVNIILRRDFEGAETRLRVGGAKGGAGSVQLGQTFGTTWSSGSALLAYEYEHRDALPYAARPYTATADLRGFGGTDHRNFLAHPGNVLVLTGGAYQPRFAIPSGQNGVDLTPASFLPGQVNLANPNAGMDLTPEQTRQGLYGSLNQSLGDRVELSFDARFSRREFSFHGAPSTSTITVTPANPYFVSPTGAASTVIGYSFFDELGASRGGGTAESFGVTGGADIALAGSWQAQVYGALAQEHSQTRTRNVINSLLLREALGTAPDNPATAFSAPRDGYFNPFGAGGANSRAVLDFVGSGYTAPEFRSRVTTLSAQADGDLFTLPAGAVKLALGAQTRRETFEQHIVTFRSSPTPFTLVTPDAQRTVSALFAEARAPLIGPADGATAPRLELSLAARFERYDDVGDSTNPKIGLLWRPTPDLRLRATYGTSFRAPSLTEVNEAYGVGPTFLNQGAARILTLIQTGGNTSLKPETATSWTAGADYAPAPMGGLTLGATLFETTFNDRIGQPVLTNLAGALNDPALSSFITPLDASRPADLARINALISDPSYSASTTYPPAAFGALLDARFVNTAKVQVRGLDLNAGISFDRDADHFDLAANASYLFAYSRQLTPTSPAQDLQGIAGFPARLRARASGGWRNGAYGATLSVNYLSDEKAANGTAIESWTTADLQLRWSPQVTSGPLAGLTALASVQNIFDTDPPFYDAPQGIGYDPANADAMGRVISLQLTKRW